MRRIYVWQYILIGLAWLLALVAWPFRAAELNLFLGWDGTLDTPKFVRFLLGQPPAIFGGDAEPLTGIQSAWLALVFAGLLIFIFALVMVKRRDSWRAPGQRLVRAMGLPLLAWPISLFVPEDWNLPRPLAGMYLIGAAHVVMFAALMLTPASKDAPADAVEPRLRGSNGRVL